MEKARFWKTFQWTFCPQLNKLDVNRADVVGSASFEKYFNFNTSHKSKNLIRRHTIKFLHEHFRNGNQSWEKTHCSQFGETETHKHSTAKEQMITPAYKCGQYYCTYTHLQHKRCTCCSPHTHFHLPNRLEWDPCALVLQKIFTSVVEQHILPNAEYLFNTFT